ncbi:MAG: ATP-dependent sacrificial sulfur transferase LarE [Methanothrix sp.]|nr:ATP-dependent sacrificial sulfur transferase LarE [Methanothrix sp.]
MRDLQDDARGRRFLRLGPLQIKEDLMDWQDRLADLRQRIAKKEKILIAYSGGVDSSLLASVASDVLKENALCVILDSETLPRSEFLHAGELARSLGLNFEVRKCSLLSLEGFANNPPNRCYFCKKASFGELFSLARDRGIDCIADGLNQSDYDDYRPGIAACREMGIWHPFVDAGISKKDIREIARNMGLSFWDKPSSACLSSRIPYGEKIRVDNLLMVEQAEDFLKSLGFIQVRVRAHGKLARIEFLEEDLQRALNCRVEISRKFRFIGFLYAAMDLSGFRSGSMNEMLERETGRDIRNF